VAPGFDRGEQAVGEGEEGIRGNRRADRARLRPAGLVGSVLRLPRGDARRFEAVHLARADTGRAAALGIDDRVRLDVLGDGPGEAAIGEFLLGRRALRDDLEVGLAAA
jgi:hypothetical protein